MYTEKEKGKALALYDKTKSIAEVIRRLGYPSRQAMYAVHIVLKGGLLSNFSEDDEIIYEDGERASNDIDILVKPDGLNAVGKALSELGFVQGIYNDRLNEIEKFNRLEIIKRRMNRGEVAPYVKITDNKEFPFVEVDINFSLGNTPSEGKELLTAMVDNGFVYPGRVEMRVTNQELFFLHLIMHQYKEICLLFMTERGKDLDMYKLADIYYLFKANILDFEILNKYIITYNIEQEVGSVLQQVGEVFADGKIIELSGKYKHSQPRVIDYDNKKVYEWQATVRERICSFKTSQFLKEVE